jgi:hypothetical protein
MRSKLVNDAQEAKLRLEKYDSFFDTLVNNEILYEQILYNDCPVKIIRWIRETGDIIIESSYNEESVIKYWELTFSMKKLD